MKSLHLNKNSKSLVRSLIPAIVAAGFAFGLSACSTAKTSKLATVDAKSSLHVERYVGSEAGFLVTSNLIVGREEAVLIDAQFTRADAANVVKMIRASGKPLKTIFITHGHPDHYFGAEVLQREFPDARLVATTETIEDIKRSASGKLAYWKGIYKEQITDTVPVIKPVRPEDLSLDGEQFELRNVGPGESEHASVVVVKSLKSAFVGDIAYDRVHLWLADAEHSIDSWIANINTLSNDASIESIYVGHQKDSVTNSKQVLKTNLEYIDRAQSIFKAAPNAKVAAEQLKATYPAFALPIIADIAAGALVK